MKTVLFIPGFKEKLSSRNYKKTMAVIKSAGYTVKFVPINWWHTTIGDWVTEVNKTYSNHSSKNTVLAGFSYGAMTALVSAAEKNPTELWLFSLSPYFKEDIPGLKQAWLDDIGKHRTETFKHLSFNNTAQKIHCKTLIFVGEKEAQMYPDLGLRATKAHQKIANSELLTVPNCKHDVTDDKYIKVIQNSI